MMNLRTVAPTTVQKTTETAKMAVATTVRRTIETVKITAPVQRAK
jgi:hypothetical protein